MICVGHYPCSLPALLNGFLWPKKIKKIKRGPKKDAIILQSTFNGFSPSMVYSCGCTRLPKSDTGSLKLFCQFGPRRDTSWHWGKICWEASLCSETALPTWKNMSETTFLQSFPRFRSCTPGCDRCRNRDCHHTTLANFIWKIGRAACQGHASLHMKFCQTLSNILSQSA